MSFLREFAGNLALNLGKQAEDERLMKLQEEMDRRRRELDLEFDDKARVREKRDWVEKENATRTPMAIGGMLVDREFSVDDQGRLSRQDRALGAAPKMPEGRPYKVERGDKVEYWQRYTDGTESRMSEAPRYKPQDGSGAAPAIPRDALGMTEKDRRVEDRAARAEERALRSQAIQEARDEVEPYLSRIDELNDVEPVTEEGASGTSELRRFMAQQGAEGSALTNRSEAKAWMLRKAREAKFREYGIGSEPASTQPAGKQGEKPGNSQWKVSAAPPAAVAELKRDPSPEAKREFDAIFGAGAAARALGGR